MSGDDIRGPGGLFLAGSARDRSPEDGSTLAELLGVAGGPASARIVLVWVSSRGSRGLDESARTLERLGAADVRTLEVSGRGDADRAHAIGLVERATAVVVDGESPRGVVRALRETKLDSAFHRGLGDSLVVAGFGHGASALAARFLVDGATDPDFGPEPEVVAPVTGLGYFPGAVMDPFFARDGQPERLLSALLDRPDDLGFGLGDLAAIRVAGGRFEVLGSGTIAVVDAAGAGKFVQHILRPGDGFDLRNRCIEI